MDDPRDIAREPEEHLTEDSDDALADLEKEFEAKKLRLLEERELKRQRKRSHVQIERSPSPERIAPPAAKVAKVEEAPKKPSSFVRVQPKTTAFADKLYDLKTTEQRPFDYNERVFEFENIPASSIQPSDARDSVSGELLSRRYMLEPELDRLVAGKKILRVQKLLAKVVGPLYEEPRYVNWCFAGIIVHKSEPRVSVNSSKYLSLRVGNFVHNVDVMLFGDAFKKYWKLRVGDIIVVLNPTVKKYAGGFNVSLLEDLDNVVEIGTLRNFGHCLGQSKLGEKCKHVVDISKNTLCTFHEESKYKQGSRMELHGSVKPKAPQNARGERSQMYVNASTNQPSFVSYNPGATQKDQVYAGGEQFDNRKYDKAPVESAAARKRKQLANKRLETQLLQNVAPRHLNDLQKLGIVHRDRTGLQDHHNKTEAIRQQAFKSTFITKMGFDPTNVPDNDPNREDNMRLQSLQELHLLSRAKNVSLERSREEKAKQKLKWKLNINFLKPGASKVVPNSATSPSISLLDDDSDIEIAFGNEADKSSYEHVKALRHPALT